MPTVEQPTDRKSVTLPTRLWAAIGEYRFYNRIPTEAEAIRQLLDRGLAAPTTIKMIINILSRQAKHIDGPFGSAERSAFVLTDQMTALLQQEDRLPEPDARQRAQAVVERVLQACGADIDMTRDMLNAAWRFWLQ